MNIIKRIIRILKFRRDWRKRNKHNQTTVVKYFNPDRVTVGKETYGRLNVDMYNKGENNVLSIGSFCSIASNVRFLCGGDHFKDRLLTYPIEKKIFNIDEATSKGRIIIEDDVWIGTNVLVLSGVHIGRGAIIAAGAVVSKDIPPYSIVAGVPAKIIKYRFDHEVIQKLMTIDFEKIDKNVIMNNAQLFRKRISKENIDLVIKNLK